jgi:hypothetical protein
VVSQWTVAMAAYVLGFCVVPAHEAFGELLQELTLAIRDALPTLAQPRFRGKLAFAVSVAVATFVYAPGSIVLRITGASWCGVGSLVWQLGLGKVKSA